MMRGAGVMKTGVTTPKLVDWWQANSAPSGAPTPWGLAPELEVQMHPQSNTRLCEHCGAGFTAPPSRRPRFCGWPCYTAARRSSEWTFDVEHFWNRVDRREACWLWTAGQDTNGYGAVGIGDRSERAHRIAYSLASGLPILSGQKVLHTCDTRLCVRNDDAGTYEVNGVALPRFGHLFLGTIADNNADMIAKGRHRVLFGERNGRAVLTETAVRDIRRLYQDGVGCVTIGRQFGVNPNTVMDIVRREKWPHVV